eukprot:8762417-Karenia_brevis.AAC.1
MTIASTTQQKLAGQLLDEQVLTRDELSDMFSVFENLLKTNMKGRETITSVEVKAILEDAIDAVK